MDPSASATHAARPATAAMAVTADLFGESTLTTPHCVPRSVSQVATPPHSVPVQSNADASSAAIAVTSPKHIPRHLLLSVPVRFGTSLPSASVVLVGSVEIPAIFRCVSRNRSYADRLADLLLDHQSSLPSTPAAHITRTFPPRIQCVAPPRSIRRGRSGITEAFRVPPLFPLRVMPSTPGPGATVPPNPSPPTAPVRFQSCASSVSRSLRSSSNFDSVAR